MRRVAGGLYVVLLVLAPLACGSSSKPLAQSTQSHTASTRTAADPAAALQRSVRTALAGNYQLAVYVLWNNRLPSWAGRSTEGPALASLRSAATTRRSRGVRVRMVAHRRRIVRMTLDPSYARASAVILDVQRVQPSTASGRPRGQIVTLHERARYELHRVGSSNRFLVWKVVLLQ
jgi:hypothetical protein